MDKATAEVQGVQHTIDVAGVANIGKTNEFHTLQNYFVRLLLAHLGTHYTALIGLIFGHGGVLLYELAIAVLLKIGLKMIDIQLGSLWCHTQFEELLHKYHMLEDMILTDRQHHLVRHFWSDAGSIQALRELHDFPYQLLSLDKVDALTHHLPHYHWKCIRREEFGNELWQRASHEPDNNLPRDIYDLGQFNLPCEDFEHLPDRTFPQQDVLHHHFSKHFILD